MTISQMTYREMITKLQSLSEEQLDQVARIIIDDESDSKLISFIEPLEEDVYINKDDSEDGGSLEDLKSLHGDDFNENDYILSTHKGRVFIYSCEGLEMMDEYMKTKKERIKISLIHPSRGRADKALSTYRYWMLQSSGEHEIEHILSIDQDDKQIDYYNENFNFENSVIIVNENKNLVEATNRVIDYASGTIFVLLSDDFSCPENWDKLIVEAFDGEYDRVLKTFDGVQSWIVTLPIMGKKYCDDKKYFYFPEYHHMFCDTDMTHMAELEGKLIARNDIEFIHEHYSTGKVSKDATNEKADSTWNNGESTYLNRVKNKFGLDPNTDVFRLSANAGPHISWLRNKLK